MKKTNRDFKVDGVNYSIANSPSYNKNCAYELGCQKYYAIKLIDIGCAKSWVKTHISGNTIDCVKEKVKEWCDFVKYIENEHGINLDDGDNTN